MSDGQADGAPKLRSDLYHQRAKRSDPIAGTIYRDSLVKEEMIHNAQLRILREKLQACNKREQVNHYKNCEKFARAYYNAIKDRVPHAPSSQQGPVEMSDIE